MKIYSLARHENKFFAIEIEVSLIPGLPTIHFSGLPDAAIRESVPRLKSALKRQGFQFPRAQQVVVHLRPGHIRKQSMGLDLALVAAILWQTKQVRRPKEDHVLLYGEVGPGGDVRAPEDLVDVESDIQLSDGMRASCLYTGRSFQSGHWSEIRRLSSLRDLGSPHVVKPLPFEFKWERPTPIATHWTSEQARLLSLIAAGEHPTLILGPQGTGKTYLASAVHGFLAELNELPRRHCHKIQKLFSEPAQWRPFVQPHHSASGRALIGGGTPPAPGEITRAHLGVFLMDEVLEFERYAQDALREPLEEGCIRLNRGSKRTVYPAQFLLIGTSNLCHCGRATLESRANCRCLPRDHVRYVRRLSGPFGDRFHIWASSSRWTRDPASVATETIWDICQRASAFRIARNQTQPNAFRTLASLESELDPLLVPLLPELQSSRRRRLAFLRVARTLADLDASPKIREPHIAEAFQWTQAPLFQLENL